jgi:hypothetical protein
MPYAPKWEQQERERERERGRGYTAVNEMSKVVIREEFEMLK